MMMCVVFMYVAFIWILSSYGSPTENEIGGKKLNTDSLGHFGGFLTGILVGLWLPKPLEASEWTKGCS